MTCKGCELAAATRYAGLYVLTCLDCCIRLVLSAHPSKERAAAMLAVIEHGPGAPDRAQILAGVQKALDARAASQAERSGAVSPGARPSGRRSVHQQLPGSRRFSGGRS